VKFNISPLIHLSEFIPTGPASASLRFTTIYFFDSLQIPRSDVFTLSFFSKSVRFEDSKRFVDSVTTNSFDSISATQSQLRRPHSVVTPLFDRTGILKISFPFVKMEESDQGGETAGETKTLSALWMSVGVAAAVLLIVILLIVWFLIARSRRRETEKIDEDVEIDFDNEQHTSASFSFESSEQIGCLLEAGFLWEESFKNLSPAQIEESVYY
jgi:hypothetical protein